MKNLLILSGLVISAMTNSAMAKEFCSIELAKKFSAAVINIETTENPKAYNSTGKLVFNKTGSFQFDQNSATEADAVILKNPKLRMYRLKYTWKNTNNLNYGFYYKVTLSNTENGCFFTKLITE